MIVRKCGEFVARFGTFNDAQDLEDQLQTVLKSDSPGAWMFLYPIDFIVEEVQETLLGLLGFDDMDFVQNLLTHRDDITLSFVCIFKSWLTSGFQW